MVREQRNKVGRARVCRHHRSPLYRLAGFALLPIPIQSNSGIRIPSSSVAFAFAFGARRQQPSSSSRSRNSLRFCAKFVGHFGIPRPRDPIRILLRSVRARGAPRATSRTNRIDSEEGPLNSARRGVDATRRWIAAASGVVLATAAVRTRSLPPHRRRRGPGRPRFRRRQGPGRPRHRRRGRRRTPEPASARRCCHGICQAARRARARRVPSGACSGRIATGRSSPRSWNSSLVIQVTRTMNIWILAYAQSCKYRRAESPVHLAQVESMNV